MTTAIILDWDDTLLPSTLIQNSYFIDHSILRNLETILICFVSLLTTKGDVNIVTNSNFEWLYPSCEKYYPNFYVLLKQLHAVSTFSIRDKCESKDPTVWKACAMREIIKNKNYTQIISFGDAHFERIAVFTIGKLMNCRAKHIHFISRPSIKDLEYEWLKIHKIIDDIFIDPRTIDICLQKINNSQYFDIVVNEVSLTPKIETNEPQPQSQLENERVSVHLVEVVKI